MCSLEFDIFLSGRNLPTVGGMYCLCRQGKRQHHSTETLGFFSRTQLKINKAERVSAVGRHLE